MINDTNFLAILSTSHDYDGQWGKGRFPSEAFSNFRQEVKVASFRSSIDVALWSVHCGDIHVDNDGGIQCFDWQGDLTHPLDYQSTLNMAYPISRQMVAKRKILYSWDMGYIFVTYAHKTAHGIQLSYLNLYSANKGTKETFIDNVHWNKDIYEVNPRMFTKDEIHDYILNNYNLMLER